MAKTPALRRRGRPPRPQIRLFLLGHRGDPAGKHASLLPDPVVILLRFTDRLGRRFDCRIEGDDGGVPRRCLLAEVSRQSLAFGQLSTRARVKRRGGQLFHRGNSRVGDSTPANSTTRDNRYYRA
jgi:hypothetical protein